MSNFPPTETLGNKPLPRHAKRHPYVCPFCHSPLEETAALLRCTLCERAYPAEHEIVDFAEGEYYDTFVPGQQLSPSETAGLAGEFAGATARADFYLERLRRRTKATNLQDDGPMRLLDCGCGNGVSVDEFNRTGLAAWGNDSSALRKWQWRDREFRHRLLVCDARRLPFAQGFFDAILCSGLLEHIGVHEERTERYSVVPRATRSDERRELLSELLRVLDGGGVLWLDFPNGAFPADFWHASKAGIRFHWPGEPFLPTMREVRGYINAVDPTATVRALSPQGRLQFQQVRDHWYGRLFAPLAEQYFRLLSKPLAHSLRGSFLNPYLVLEVRRHISI